MLSNELRMRFRARSDVALGKGASQGDLQEVERLLGLRLAGGYVFFLREFGWASIGSFEVYGTGPDVPRHLDIVRMTLSERAEARPCLPMRLLPISNDGFGNHYCLDVGEARQTEPSVVFWKHEESAIQSPEKVALTFEDWLIESLDGP